MTLLSTRTSLLLLATLAPASTAGCSQGPSRLPRLDEAEPSLQAPTLGQEVADSGIADGRAPGLGDAGEGIPKTPSSGAGAVVGSLTDAAGIVPVVVTADTPVAPVCEAGESWSGQKEVEMFPPDAERLLAVAATSGTRVFTATCGGDAGQGSQPDDADADAGTGAGADAGTDAGARPACILVADSDAVVEVSVPPSFDLEAGVGIHPSGLRLLFVARDRAGLSSNRRAELGERFGAPDADSFERINALGAQGGLRFSNPVWSASGKRIYLTENGVPTNSLQLRRQDGFWSVESRLDQASLLDVEVTSVSADDLTLFTWDALNDAVTAHWRERFDLPVQESRPLETDRPVHVDDSCTELRYERPCESECRELVLQRSD